MLSTLHLHWKSACQIKGSGSQPLRRSLDPWVLEKAFPSIIGCSISVSKEKGSGRAWKGFSSLSLYWRKRNCLVVWERKKSQLKKEQSSKPKLRLGQTGCCSARWCEQERATAAQGDAVGVCLKEFTPPPEPLSKGLHCGRCPTCFQWSRAPRGCSGLWFVLWELEKRRSLETTCVHASQWQMNGLFL